MASALSSARHPPCEKPPTTTRSAPCSSTSSRTARRTVCVAAGQSSGVPRPARRGREGGRAGGWAAAAAVAVGDAPHATGSRPTQRDGQAAALHGRGFVVVAPARRPRCRGGSRGRRAGSVSRASPSSWFDGTRRCSLPVPRGRWGTPSAPPRPSHGSGRVPACPAAGRGAGTPVALPPSALTPLL
eukprot:scaffold1644_cov357-Prasinococcus_capsulatus_cf.AAC.6